MKNNTTYFYWLILLPLLQACNSMVDENQIKDEILALHQQERVFHVEKKADEFADYLSTDVIMLNRGTVRNPSREENRERFQKYFNSVEFEEWDDTADPVIRISKDGSMAHVVVQKRVTVKYEGPSGDTIQGTTEYAWLSVYEKENGEWKLTRNASTNQPGTESTRDELAVRALNKAYLQNWLNHDEAGVLSLFEEGARISPSSLCPVDSLDKMRQFWFPRDNSTTTVHQFEAEELALQVMDTLAFSTQKTLLEWSYEKEGFEMGRIQEGIETTIFRRQPDGSWKIWRKQWTDVSVKDR